jgi:hypothetical protein
VQGTFGARYHDRGRGSLFVGLGVIQCVLDAGFERYLEVVVVENRVGSGCWLALIPTR